MCVCICSAFVIERHIDRVLKVSAGKSLGFSLSVRCVVIALLFTTHLSVCMCSTASHIMYTAGSPVANWAHSMGP